MKFKNIYKKNYFSSHPGIIASTRLFNEHDYKSYNLIYGKIIDINPRKIIDLGCGYGSMLKFLSEKYPDAEVQGLDPSLESVNFCKDNYDIKVINNDIETYIQNSIEKFDLILLNDVIEHFDKEYVIKTLSLIRNKLLADSGRLIITVPNLGNPFSQNDMWHDYTHINGFNSNSLEQVANLCGYSRTTIFSNSGHGSAVKVFVQTFLRKALAKLFKITFGMRLTDIYYGTKLISCSQK